MKFLNIDPKIVFRWDYLKFLSVANNIRVQKIVEVGTWDGKNAKKLRKLFPDAHLYLIDPYHPTLAYFQKGDPASFKPEEYEKTYQKVCKHFAKDSKTTILKTTSINGVDQVPNNIDLVFIDGDHSYEHVKQDILTWKRKVRVGGLLTGHDYSLAFPDVMKAVNECLPNKFVVGKDSVWAVITSDV